MKTKVVERNEVIATRVPPGDRWTLVEDSKKIIHKTLTDALEAYLNSTGCKGEYRLAPLDSKLYAIKTSEEEIKPEPVKKYNIYGDDYSINMYDIEQGTYNDVIYPSLDPKNKTSSPPQENFGHGRGKRYIIENGEIVDCIPV